MCGPATTRLICARGDHSPPAPPPESMTRDAPSHRRSPQSRFPTLLAKSLSSDLFFLLPSPFYPSPTPYLDLPGQHVGRQRSSGLGRCLSPFCVTNATFVSVPDLFRGRCPGRPGAGWVPQSTPEVGAGRLLREPPGVCWRDSDASPGTGSAGSSGARPRSGTASRPGWECRGPQAAGPQPPSRAKPPAEEPGQLLARCRRLSCCSFVPWRGCTANSWLRINHFSLLPLTEAVLTSCPWFRLSPGLLRKGGTFALPPPTPSGACDPDQ